jgi:hypothetical protein
MATGILDWSKCPAVESIPGNVSGAWVFKDTRMPVSVVFENLEAGRTYRQTESRSAATESPKALSHLVQQYRVFR